MGYPRLINKVADLSEEMQPGKIIGTDYHIIEDVDESMTRLFVYTKHKTLVRMMRIGERTWRVFEINPIEHPDYDEYREPGRSEVQLSDQDEKDPNRE